MEPKLLSELIPRAEAYLAHKGYGSGTNYSTSQVAGMMAMFALECARDKCTLPKVSVAVCPNCGGKDIRPYKGHFCCYECSEFFEQTER